MPAPLSPASASPMLSRSRGAIRLALAAALLLGCAMLFVGQLAEQAPRWQKELWNLGHVGLFAGLAMAAWPWLRGRLWRRALALLAVAAVAGASVELIQARIGRDCSLLDLLLDILGAAVGILLAARRELAPMQRLLLWLPLLAGLTLAASPLLLSGWDAFEAPRQFPRLASFEAASERYRVHLYGGTYGRVEAGALRLHMGGPATFSGFAFDQLPRDWRGYGALRLELENPADTPLGITCRINDRDHFRRGSPDGDRFDRRLLLAPGLNSVRFDLAEVAAAPATRPLRLDDIAELGCFVVDQGRRRPLWLHEMTLE